MRIRYEYTSGGTAGKVHFDVMLMYGPPNAWIPVRLYVDRYGEQWEIDEERLTPSPASGREEG